MGSNGADEKFRYPGWHPVERSRAKWRWWTGTDWSGEVFGPGTGHERLINGVLTAGSKPIDHVWRTVEEHGGGEVPWAMVSSGLGALIAFHDRLMLLTFGGLRALIRGDGELTVAPYSDVVDIRYESGVVNGTLEVVLDRSVFAPRATLGLSRDQHADAREVLRYLDAAVQEARTRPP